MFSYWKSWFRSPSEESPATCNSAREQPVCQEKVQKQQKFLTGVVTSLSVTANSGMINNFLFFDMGVVLGGVKVEVNDAVYAEARRSHSNAGWTAIRVEVLSSWLPDGESDVEVVVGYISGLGGKRGVVTSEEKEVSFPLDMAQSMEGYQPHLYDWVKLYLLHQDNEINVNELRPLRELSETGVKVTHVTHGYGTVGADVFFTLSSCCHGYHPRRGDLVDIECVEYKHHKNNWRAYRVTPHSDHTHSPQSSLYPASGKGSSFPRPAIPLLSTNGQVVKTTNESPVSTSAPVSATPTSPVDNVVPPCPEFPRAPRVPTTTSIQGSYQDKLGACRIPGQRPIRKQGVQKLKSHLRQYEVPEDLRECVGEGLTGDVMAIEPTLEEPLCMENYRARFQTLLYLEELQREVDIRHFDLTSVGLQRQGPYLSLTVPGLAEGRPSLLVGDRAILCDEGGDEGVVHWEGYIHEVRNSDVLLKFADHFHDNFSHQNYDVMFAFNRMQFRRMHRAVEQCRLIGQEILFPWQPAVHPPRATPTQWFNSALNSHQRAAVVRILGEQCVPAPYIVFGPPGTGKTVTLVEAILQVVSLVKGSRVLVCAPSNSAADLLAQRLCRAGKLNPADLCRLNAIQRPFTTPPSILRHCKDTDSAESAVRCRIVVVTCSTAGYLGSLELGVGHFSHVFVDEAGQATETECLLPIALLAGSIGQVVLAGDPYQLGPVLSSRLADGCGFSLSLLERLMERLPYQRDKAKFGNHGNYDPLLVTKLVHNYRSHAHLLKLYSDLFYHGELQVCAPPSKTHLLLEWEGLPKKGFPLIFHGVVGEDMQEGNSPSWFNPVEAVQVVRYVQALKENSTFAPRLSELAVVTPYRKQVEKIRHMLGKLGCGGGGVAVGGVKVGSVEEFQGQERTAIIISTVRSNGDLVDEDVRHHLGFLSNAKRFNVAISRACALLVVVGNPLLLAKDPHWNELLQYAVRNGAYKGCPLEGVADLAAIATI